MLLDFVFSSWVGARFDRGSTSKKRKRVNGAQLNVSPYGIRFRKPEEAEPNGSMEAFFSVYRHSTLEQLREFQAYEKDLPSNTAELRRCLVSSYPKCLEFHPTCDGGRDQMDVDAANPTSTEVHLAAGLFLDSVFRNAYSQFRPEYSQPAAPICVLSY